MSGGTDDINAKVEAGTKSFDAFEQTLEDMLVSMKEQHSLMVSLNETKLKVRKCI